MKTEFVEDALKKAAKDLEAAATALKNIQEDQSLNPEEKFDKMVKIVTNLGALTA